MNFPTDPLDVRLVYAFGVSLTAAPTSWTWTDCTSDLRTSSDQSVDIKVGRGDRAKQGEPNQATFSLNNFNGQYTVDNPAGAFFPNIVENVPGIVAVGRNANPTFEVDASDWAAVHGTVARSTVRALKGTASLLLTPTGGFTTAVAGITTAIPVRDGGAVYVDAWVYSPTGWGSVQLTVDWLNASNVLISSSNGPVVAIPAGVWTYVGAYFGPAPAGTAKVESNVVESGTPAAINTLWIDEARTSIPELCGYVDGWTPQFDDSGNLATVAVSVSSGRRRMGRGEEPRQSALYRSILAAAPVAYWPLEDGSTSTSAGAATPNTLTMAAPGVVFAAQSDLIGSQPTPTVTSASVTGQISGVSATGWYVVFSVKTLQSVRLAAKIRTASATYAEFRVFTPSAGSPEVQGGVNDANGNALLAPLHGTTVDPVAWTATWHQIAITAEQIGGNVVVKLWVDGAVQATNTSAGTLSAPTLFQGNPDAVSFTTSIAHVAAGNGVTPPGAAAMTGYPGELAATRTARQCAEEGVQLAAINNAAKSMPMGPQPVDTFLNLLQANEDADGGMLYEPFDGFGFGYVVRADLYNLPVALTIDRAAGQLAPPFAPVHDDLQRQNDVTVTRAGGSSARYVGDTSRGSYKDTPTLYVATDDVLLNIAAWRVHLGSPRGRLRYPSLSVNFANAQAAALGPAFGATRGVAIRVQVVNPPPQVPQGVDVLVSGYTKTLAYKAWKVALLGTPYEAWRVFTIGDPVLGRLDSGASTLTGGPYSAGAVSLSVATSTGPLWITTAGQPTKFPFDADISGQRVTVTGISGVASPQTFTVAATPAALSNGAPVKLWRPACLAL